MHQALYRKWRPNTFNDVHGQDHITSVLKYEVENSKFSHAYLFCGSRGTGKTTCAKILAKAVNCESPINGNPCNKCPSCLAIDNGTTTDVLEMDAASNNGVDDIRDIRDEVVYTPSFLKYRVYIVDEVHMLSSSAFNALLKTLEEPPSHVVFILATTELQKLPATIVSRCQRFDFRRISVSDIMARLAFIAQSEGLSVENDALRLVAKYSQGGMRDAISLLELCAGNRSKLSVSDVTDTIGTISSELISKVLVAVNDKNYDYIFSVTNDIINSSKDITIFFDDLIAYCRNLLVCKTISSPETYFDLTEVEKTQLKSTAELFSKETILYFIRLLSDASFMMQKSGFTKRYIAEMTLIRMGDESLDTSLDAITSRISKLESQISMGNVTFKPTNTQANDVKVSKEVAPPVIKEEVKESTQEVPKADNSTEKPVRGWPEIIQKLTDTNPGQSSFLKTSRAFQLANGKISVKFKNSFGKQMFEDTGLVPLLCSMLAERLKHPVTETDIELTVSTEPISDFDSLDDILN